jgi:hypothetical protein
MPQGQSTPMLPAENIPARSYREMASYIWQLFLPRVPWQMDHFGNWPPQDIWLRGLLGTYGWLDYAVPAWLFALGKKIAWALVVLVACAAVQHWRGLWRNRAEIAVLAAFALALALVIGFGGYEYRRTTGMVFEQARYLFPVAGLYAVVVAFACLGLGRRVAPGLAIGLVTLFALHEVSGILLTYARYYG